MTEKREDNSQFENAVQDPSSFFENPKDVVGSDHFTTSQKLEILKSWEFDAKRLQESAGEAMAGGEGAPLAQVQECIRELTSEE